MNFKTALLMVAFVLFMTVAQSEEKSLTSKVITSDKSARCLNCHGSRQKKLVENWEKSKHSRNRVGCYECHQADPSDAAAKKGHFGFTVKIPVSPKRCATCHAEQYASFASSSHALAYETIRHAAIASESPVLFETTCASCHGNELVMTNGKFAPHKWPNHGIGRINTDGSRGSCVACHSHHDYSLLSARSAETCGRCHRGPTGPAYEAWKTSKHGSNFDKLSRDVDYSASSDDFASQDLSVPDCFACHMGATDKNKKDSTHNPGERLSWKIASLKSIHTGNWGQKRRKMQDVCRKCHGNSQVDIFYRRFDATIMEVNKLTDAAVANCGSDTAMIEALKGAAISAKTSAAMISPYHLRESIQKIK